MDGLFAPRRSLFGFDSTDNDPRPIVDRIAPHRPGVLATAELINLINLHRGENRARNIVYPIYQHGFIRPWELMPTDNGITNFQNNPELQSYLVPLETFLEEALADPKTAALVAMDDEAHYALIQRQEARGDLYQEFIERGIAVLAAHVQTS